MVVLVLTTLLRGWADVKKCEIIAGLFQLKYSTLFEETIRC